MTTGAAEIALGSNVDGAEPRATRTLNEEYSMANAVEGESSSYQGFIKVKEIEEERVRHGSMK